MGQIICFYFALLFVVFQVCKQRDNEKKSRLEVGRSVHMLVDKGQTYPFTPFHFTPSPHTPSFHTAVPHMHNVSIYVYIHTFITPCLTFRLIPLYTCTHHLNSCYHSIITPTSPLPIIYMLVLSFFIFFFNSGTILTKNKMSTKF